MSEEHHWKIMHGRPFPDHGGAEIALLLRSMSMGDSFIFPASKARLVRETAKEEPGTFVIHKLDESQSRDLENRMKLPKPDDRGDFMPAPAGTHVATCYRVIDLGTQMDDGQFGKKVQHKVMLFWELGDEMMEDGRPFVMSRRYTFSTHEKATLRHDLEAWRGKAFTDADFEGPNAFDMKKLLGQSCMLTVVQQTKEGKTRARIAGVSKLTKGITPAPLINKRVFLGVSEPEDWDASIYAELPEWLKQTIAQSPEYRQIVHGDGDGGLPERVPSDFLDDDVPF